MDKKKFYTTSDSSSVFLWALLLPQVVSLILALVFSCVYKNQEEMLSSLFYLIVCALLAQLCFAFIVFYYNKKNKIDIKLATKTNFNLSVKNVAVCILISIVAVFGFINIITIISNALTNIGFADGVSLPNNTFYWFIINVVILAFLPCVLEETIFRGIIFNGLRSKGFVFATLVSSLMFAIIHLSAKQFVFPFVMGVVFCFILEKTGSLIYSMITHFCNNFIVLLISYIGNKTDKNIALLQIENTWLLVALSIIIAALAAVVIFVLIKFALTSKNAESNSNAQNNQGQISQSTTEQKQKSITMALVVGIVLWVLYVVLSLI